MDNLLGVRHSLTLKKQMRTAREGVEMGLSCWVSLQHFHTEAKETRCLAFIRLHSFISSCQLFLSPATFWCIFSNTNLPDSS